MCGCSLLWPQPRPQPPPQGASPTPAGFILYWAFVTEQQWELGCAGLQHGLEGVTHKLSVCQAAQSSILGARAASGPVPNQYLHKHCWTLTEALWLLWDRCVLNFLAGWSVLCTSVPQERLSPQKQVPKVLGASQSVLVISFMAMPSASAAMAMATASPRRKISHLVTTGVAGSEVGDVASRSSSRDVGSSTLVMPVSTTSLCTSNPAARRTGIEGFGRD